MSSILPLMLFTPPELDDRELQVLAEITDLRHRLQQQVPEPSGQNGSLHGLLARALQGADSGEDSGADRGEAAGEEPAPLEQDAEPALRGYLSAMTYVVILASDTESGFSCDIIKALHFIMTSYDLGQRPGRWRAGPVQVVNDRTGEVAYQGPDAGEVPGLMRELTVRLDEARDQRAGHAQRIIHGAMAHLNLVGIHPFLDGNGRMGRVLQSLVLARGAVLEPTFMSIEEYTARHSRTYYEAIKGVQGGSWQPSNSARPWIRFVLTAHLREARALAWRITQTRRLLASLEEVIRQHQFPGRVMPVLLDACAGHTVGTARYLASLQAAGQAPVTRETATRDLHQLAEARLLAPADEGPGGGSYTGTPELAQIPDDIIASRNPADDTDPFAT